MLAVYIQYQYISITKCQLSLLIGIGYILPTFGECTSFGGFLCALRAQGWGIFLVRNVHFLICILVLDINCQHLGNIRHLEGFCAPFGRRVGEYVWSGMYIFLYHIGYNKFNPSSYVITHQQKLSHTIASYRPSPLTSPIYVYYCVCRYVQNDYCEHTFKCIRVTSKRTHLLFMVWFGKYWSFRSGTLFTSNGVLNVPKP